MSAEDDAVFISFPSTSLEDQNARREFFTGDIAEWAIIRARKFGDYIIPKQMYIERLGTNEQHSVAWIEHSGVDSETGDEYRIHHIACDCVRHKSVDQIPDELALLDCEVMDRGLIERAHFVERSLGLKSIITVFEEEKKIDPQKEGELQDFILESMFFILKHDKAEPYYWLGNTMSGEHTVDTMSEILGKPVEVVQMYSGILELEGRIEFDGDTMRLPSAA